MLFESLHGYALFGAHHVNNVERNYRAIEEYINRFGEVFDLIAYHPLESANEALIYLTQRSTVCFSMRL